MSNKPLPQNVLREPGVLNYVVVCLFALGAMVMVLQDRGLESWSLLPALVGLGGIGFRWSTAPLMVLLALAVCFMFEARQWTQFDQNALLPFPDLILSMAVLAFVMGHYRLQSLLNRAFPFAGPPRNKRSKELPGAVGKAVLPAPQRRSAHLVSRAEIGGLMLSLPLFSLWAYIFWYNLPSNWGNPGIRPLFWKAILLCWTVGMALLITAGVLDYCQRRCMTVQEATQYLQDVLWAETRGEQRRINRWLTWARLGNPLGFVDWFIDLFTLGALAAYTLIVLAVLVLVILVLFPGLI